MIDVPKELLQYAEGILRECPITFSYDLVFVPSTGLEMREGAQIKDSSWLGIVIYEDDINRYDERDRVTIGKALYDARNAFRSAGIKCEFYPLSGTREDHSLDPGLPTIGGNSSLDQ
jgi:hypothetical protein